MSIKFKHMEQLNITRNGKKMQGYYLSYEDENGKINKLRKGKVNWTQIDAFNAMQNEIQNISNPQLNSHKQKIQKTLEEVFNEYIDVKKKSKNHHKQRTNYDVTRDLKNHVLSYFMVTNQKGDKTSKYIKSINKQEIKKWQNHLINATYERDFLDSNGKKTKCELGYSENTLDKIQQRCRALFKFAVAHDYLEKNPFDNLDFLTISNHPTQPPLEVVTINKIQFKEILKVIENYVPKSGAINKLERLQDAALMSILFNLGLRVGEAVILKIGDYSIENHVLNINKNWDRVNAIESSTKSENSTRIKYVGASTHSRILNLINYYKEAGIYSEELPLFSSFTTARRRVEQKIISLNTVDRHLQRYLKLAKLPHMRVHDLRHSHGSMIKNNNFSETDAARSMGNTPNVASTVYIHIDIENEKKIQQIFE